MTQLPLGKGNPSIRVSDALCSKELWLAILPSSSSCVASIQLKGPLFLHKIVCLSFLTISFSKVNRFLQKPSTDLSCHAREMKQLRLWEPEFCCLVVRGFPADLPIVEDKCWNIWYTFEYIQIFLSRWKIVILIVVNWSAMLLHFFPGVDSGPVRVYHLLISFSLSVSAILTCKLFLSIR